MKHIIILLALLLAPLACQVKVEDQVIETVADLVRKFYIETTALRTDMVLRLHHYFQLAVSKIVQTKSELAEQGHPLTRLYRFHRATELIFQKMFDEANSIFVAYFYLIKMNHAMIMKTYTSDDTGLSETGKEQMMKLHTYCHKKYREIIARLYYISTQVDRYNELFLAFVDIGEDDAAELLFILRAKNYCLSETSYTLK